MRIYRCNKFRKNPKGGREDEQGFARSASFAAERPKGMVLARTRRNDEEKPKESGRTRAWRGGHVSGTYIRRPCFPRLGQSAGCFRRRAETTLRPVELHPSGTFLRRINRELQPPLHRIPRNTPSEQRYRLSASFPNRSEGKKACKLTLKCVRLAGDCTASRKRRCLSTAARFFTAI